MTLPCHQNGFSPIILMYWNLEKYGWDIFIPKFSYTTDNAAMIAITGYFKYLDRDFCSIDLPAYSRVTLE